MTLDSFPKKPCKHCGLKGHFPYQCRVNPKKILKRTPIKQQGKQAKQWLITRAKWIRDNPPPINDKYWECYLRIHEWCPGVVDIRTLTLDHVVSRTRDPKLRYTAKNLRPACRHCNALKGSRSLDELRPVQ